MDKERRSKKQTNSNLSDSIVDKLVFNKASFSQKSEALDDEWFSHVDYSPVDFDKKASLQVEELKKLSSSVEDQVITGKGHMSSQKRYKIDYKQELNAQQLLATTTLSSPLLVIAGAGSGKTRVITYKVSYLIENGVLPSQILLLTFTRKSANEMLSRVYKLLQDESSRNVLGGTFHSFANYVLRKYASLIGISSNFTIIDAEDASDIIDLLASELKLKGSKGYQTFPKKKVLKAVFSKSSNLDISLSSSVETFFPHLSKFKNEIEILGSALKKYKDASNVLDFDDLLAILRDKMKTNPTLKKNLQDTFQYVLVDEYQDTNNVQRDIVELIANPKGAITVVGDDSQSIYSFRGANFENILRFPKTFSGCKVVKLEENYRSNQGILNFANDIISNARVGFKKKLYSSRYVGKNPMIKRLPDSKEEAIYVVDKMLELKGNDLSYSDFSVLVRASYHSSYIQAELIARGIPFIVVGGIKFSERRHIKDVVAFLRLVFNSLDAVAWHRILKLIEGIGKVSATEVVSAIHANHGAIKFNDFSTKKYYRDLLKLENLYKHISADRNNILVTDALDAVLDFYKPILKQLEDDYESRYKDLEAFSLIARRYKKIEKFLSEFVLDPPSNKYQEESIPQLEEGKERPLVVSTIHSAKGLEWHTVFIPHAIDGLIPSARSMRTLQEIEEERRLFYVSASRAKENLFVTLPAIGSGWGGVFTKPSRFLAELKKEHYDIDSI